MDSWQRLMDRIAFVQLASFIIVIVSVVHLECSSNESLQLVIPGKGHVQWLPHKLRPPLRVIHSALTSGLRTRHKRSQEDDQFNTTSFDASNKTETVKPSRRAFISDKEIVVIVVCCSIGLVFCLLGAAISAKYYWRKVRRDSGGNYQGVLQKESSGLSDDTSIPHTHREKDGRLGHSNMFAQIDEMDEEGSCPSSPITKDKIFQNGGDIKLSLEATPTPVFGGANRVSELKEDKAVSEPFPEVMTTTVEVEVLLPSDNSSLDVEGEDEEEKEGERNGVEEAESRVYCRTGLSQSDCSLSSYTSVNPTYKYGNQVGYMAGYYGYASNTNSDLISPDSTDLLLPLPSVVNRFDIPIPKLKEEEETERLLTNVVNGSSTTLDSQSINSATAAVNDD